MPGQNDRREFWTSGDQTFASEAEYREEQARRMTELLEQLDTEDVMNANRQYALDLKYGKANGQQDGHANGATNGHGRGGGGAPRSGSSRVVAPSAAPPGLPQSGAPRPHSASVDGPPPAKKKKFRLLNGAQLNSGQFETRYLIPGLLIAGQPGGIFGSFKTLKTSLAADLMISLASGNNVCRAKALACVLA